MLSALRTENRARFKYAAIDLFAGIGGLSLGLAKAGIQSVIAVEHFREHAEAYRRNHPDTQHVIETTVESLDSRSLLRLANISKADIDFVIGGPPCQPFSMAGQRKGTLDRRGGAIGYFLRFVRAVKPHCFLMENVPGLRSIHQGEFILDIIKEFESIGYNVTKPRLLNAADFGVPQLRSRLFIVGIRDKRKRLTLPMPTHFDVRRVGDANCPFEPYITVRQATSDLPQVDDPNVSDDDFITYSTTSQNDYQSSMRDELRGAVNGNAPTRHVLQIQKVISTSAMKEGDEDPKTRYRRLFLDRPAFTLRAGSGTFTALRPIHPTLPRVITIREAARLQSFPDTVRFSSIKRWAYQQIGNSVPPLLAQAIGNEIVKRLEQQG